LRSSRPRESADQKGEQVYQIYGSVEQILAVVGKATREGLVLNEIWERISGSTLPAAGPSSPWTGQGEMRVSLLEGEELELHAGLTVPQNAQRYYEKAKEMARKASAQRRPWP